MLDASWRSQWYPAYDSRDRYSRVLCSSHEEESRDEQGLREELAWELKIGVWPQRRPLLLPPSWTLLGSLPQPLGGYGGLGESYHTNALLWEGSFSPALLGYCL